MKEHWQCIVHLVTPIVGARVWYEKKQCVKHAH
jgi:hypothetical protein